MKTFKAKQGMWLTQKDDVSDEQRFYSTEIYTPDNVSDDAYRDATNEEKEAWEERMSEIESSNNEEEYEPVEET